MNIYRAINSFINRCELITRITQSKRADKRSYGAIVFTQSKQKSIVGILISIGIFFSFCASQLTTFDCYDYDLDLDWRIVTVIRPNQILFNNSFDSFYSDWFALYTKKKKIFHKRQRCMSFFTQLITLSF